MQKVRKPKLDTDTFIEMIRAHRDGRHGKVMRDGDQYYPAQIMRDYWQDICPACWRWCNPDKEA